MQLEHTPDTRPRITIINRIPRPWRGEGPEPKEELSIGPWMDFGSQLMRIISVPPGTDIEEVKRILREHGADV